MPQAPLSDRIPFEGVLNCWNDDHDLPDLLLVISRSGKTGRLHFSNPEGDKTLDLQGGRIVFAEASSQDDGLGQYLLRTGKISLMDYTRVSKLVQPGKRLGALLVDENVLTAEDLIPAVVGQVRSIVLGLFRRTETWYRFKEEELEQKEAITLELAVPELILEGVRHVESWRRVSKGVGSLESVYRRTAAREQEWLSSRLDDDVRELMDMLATPTSLADICTRATLPDFEACRYLWAFRTLGWIDLVDVVAQPAATVSVADATEIESPAPTPADTPTLLSIEPRQPASTPEELVQTQLSIDPPVEPAPPEQAQERQSGQAAQTAQAVPAAIPASLIETQVSMTPPKELEKMLSESPAPPTPTPIPEHLNKTQLSIEPTTTAPPEPPKAIPDELMHTQMFVDPPAATPTAPKSTGELMESILEGDDPIPPAPAGVPPSPPIEQAPPAPPPMEQAPPPPPNQAATQFFDGPSALDPDVADLAPAAASPSPEPTIQPVSAAPAAPPTPPSEAPSGFEALALGGGPGPTSAPPPAATLPSPADITTQPSVEPPQAPPLDGRMASFSDLALPEDAAAKAPETPMPMVEADVAIVNAEPPPPEEPLLTPPGGGPPIQREALAPPRRRADDVHPVKDGFEHVLGDDEK